MRLLPIVFILLGSVLHAQDNQNASLQFLEGFSKQFGIQFAYNPESLNKVDLRSANNLLDLKEVFEEANVEVLEVADDRWLLKRQVGDIEKQESRTYSGRVLDSDGLPLVSALIYTGDGSSSSLTDDDGQFHISLLEGSEVCCQYLGYEVQCLSSNGSLAFELEPLMMFLEDVEIATKKVECVINVLDDSETLRLKTSTLSKSSLGKDVLRAVQMLSGIDATNDLSASLSIRAASGLQSLVTLDGIPVYNPESAFGMFSVLNPLVVTQSTLYKNTTPLEYGEFTGGYLKCIGLGDIRDKVKLSVDLNTLQSAASIQVPIGKSTQISAAFRRSNGSISNSQYYSKLRLRRNSLAQVENAFERPEQVSTSLENKFGDVYLNLSRAWKGKNSLQVSLFGNRDLSGTAYEDTYKWEREMKPDALINENYEQSKSKLNVGLSFQYKKLLKARSEFMVHYYTSRYRLFDNINSEVKVTTRLNENVNEFDSQIRNNVRDSNLKFQYLSDRKKRWSIKTGLDLRILDTYFLFRTKSQEPSSQNIDVPVITPYLGGRFNYQEQFIVDLGFRYAIVPIENPLAFSSPRGKVLLKLGEGWFLKGSASYNQQFFRPIELERQLGQATSANIIFNGKQIPIMKSGQLTLGMNYFKEGFKINGDLFVKKNTGIIEQVLVQPGNSSESNVFANNNYDLFAGVNNIVGMDISSGYERGKFSTMVSYTFSKSQDRFDQLFDNKPIIDQNNRTHQVNILGAYQVNPWTLSSTFVYGSGVYTLNRSGLDAAIERGQINPSLLFTQLPFYARWDVSASYKWVLKKGALHFDLGIFNLMNYDNVNAELYIYSLNDGDRNALGASQVSLLGRIWTLGLRYEL